MDDATIKRLVPLASRNPFVNQVSFFDFYGDWIGYDRLTSQSLRKSGQFLLGCQGAVSYKRDILVAIPS